MKPENFELAISEISWLIMTLANQGIMINNIKNSDNKQELLTQEYIELMTTPNDLNNYQEAIVDAFNKGIKIEIVSEEEKTKKRVNRTDDNELFVRLIYFGITHLNLSEEQIWLTPIGKLLDLRECHSQFLGITKPKIEVYIDDVIPYGI